jgi:hypothetical protein
MKGCHGIRKAVLDAWFFVLPVWQAPGLRFDRSLQRTGLVSKWRLSGRTSAVLGPAA